MFFLKAALFFISFSQINNFPCKKKCVCKIIMLTNNNSNKKFILFLKWQRNFPSQAFSPKKISLFLLSIRREVIKNCNENFCLNRSATLCRNVGI